MKKSFKKHLAISMLSVFAANFVGSSVKADFKRNLLVAGITVPAGLVVGIGIGIAIFSNKSDDNDKKPDSLKNQDETIKGLKTIYSSFENIIKLSTNPSINEFEQSIKNYLVEGNDYQALKDILSAFYQVCGNTGELSNEQFIACLKKISQEKGVHFELSDDKNALIVTKNSTKFLLINNPNFVNHIRINKNEINDTDFSRNRNEFDASFGNWKNKKLSDGDFVDKVGNLIKHFEIKGIQSNFTDQNKLLFSLIPGHPGFD